MKKLLNGILSGVAIVFLLSTLGCPDSGSGGGPGKATYIDSVKDMPLLLDGARGLASAVVDGTTYLFVGTESESGVNVFSLNENDGSQTLVYSVKDEGDLNLNGVFDLETAVIGPTPADETTYLFALGHNDDGISVFSVAGDGSLTSVFNLDDDNANLYLNGVIDMEAVVVGGKHFLITVGLADNGLNIFSISDKGELAVTFSYNDTAGRRLAAPKALATAVIGANTYFYTAGSEGLTALQITDAGLGQWKADLAAPPADPRGITTATIGTTTYLFASSFTGDLVNIFPIKTGADEGKIDSADRLSVGNTADRKFDGIVPLTTATIGTKTYLYVGSQNEDAITVLSVDDAGAATDVGAIVDDADTRIEEIKSLRIVTLGETPYLFATGFADDGFSAFSLDATTGMPTHASSSHDGMADPKSVFDNPIGLASIEVSGKSYFLAAGATSQGFNVFQATSSAPYLSLTDKVVEGDDAAYHLDVADDTLSMATATVGTDSYVIAGGKGAAGLSVFGIDADGKLTHKVNLNQFGDLNLNGLSDIITVKEESTGTASTYIVAAGVLSNGISSILLNADGTVTAVTTANKGNVDEGAAPIHLDRVVALATATIGTPKISYVFAAGKADNGISTFSMDDKGGLTNVATANVVDDANTYLGGVDALATAVMGSKTYLFAAGEKDKGISVFEFDAAAGTLTNVANTAEADDAAKYTLDVVSSIAAVTHSGVTYVMAAAGAPDNGVTVWELKEEEGKMVLTYHASFLDADKTEYKLEGSHDVLPAVVSGSLYFYVAGLNEDAINVFAFK